jgi:hypothetical protein
MLPPAWVLAKHAEAQTDFRGAGEWGQFVTRDGQMRLNAWKKFKKRYSAIEDPEELWKAFPLPTYVLEGPIELFYDFAPYGISMDRGAAPEPSRFNIERAGPEKPA